MIDSLQYNDQGLVPVIVQDEGTAEVLMLAWADREALRLTMETGEAHFFSRSRGELWHKGETSGNALRVRGMRRDCDGDAVLLTVVPTGPACHTGARSCFAVAQETEWELPAGGAGIMGELWRVLCERRNVPPAHSYSSRLLAGGVPEIAKKIGEEAAELVVAGFTETDDRVASETADLWFFSLALLCVRSIEPERVYRELARRRGVSVRTAE